VFLIVAHQLNRAPPEITNRPANDTDIFVVSVVTPPLGYRPERANLSKYYVSLFSLVKNESEYVREWVTFHLSVGVEHFFLVENDKRTSLRHVLDDFVSEGLVSIYCFPARQRAQKLAFNRGIEALKGISTWVGFLDIDEFAIPSGGKNLADLLRDYEKHPGLAVNWVEFGDSGFDTKPQGWVTENFVDRGPLNFEFPMPGAIGSGVNAVEMNGHARIHNTHVKCFIQPDRTEQFRSAHHFKFTNGEQAVDEKFRPVRGPFSETVSVEKIRINHYWSKSAEERSQKLAKGRVSQNSLLKRSPYTADYAARRSLAASGVLDLTAREISSAIDSAKKTNIAVPDNARVPAPRLRASLRLWSTEQMRTVLQASRKLARTIRSGRFLSTSD
jgi:hypothetical protein